MENLPCNNMCIYIIISYYIILYYIMSYYIILYSIILYILYHIISYCIILYYIIDTSPTSIHNGISNWTPIRDHKNPRQSAARVRRMRSKRASLRTRNAVTLMPSDVLLITSLRRLGKKNGDTNSPIGISSYIINGDNTTDILSSNREKNGDTILQ